MSDEENTGDRASKRSRFKSALNRTKTKLSRKGADNTDENVEDFLAAGRDSVSTGRPSISDSLTFADNNNSTETPTSGRPSTSESSTIRSTQLPVPKSFVPPPQQSPRRVFVPRIDVSNSQRYPAAQPVEQQERSRNDFLNPQYQGRSQSVSSLSKGKGRARGMSVTFTEAPPVVIGEGGDEAQAPTIEVSKARRARSVSPTPTPRTAGPVGRMWSRSPMLRKPLPEKVVSPVREEDDFFSPGLKRVQTGITSPAIESRQAQDKEYEMSLGINSASTTSAESTRRPQQPILHAPKPVHPPVPIPQVREAPPLKSTHGTKNLRSKYERGRPAPRDTSPEEAESGPNRRFYQMHAQQQELALRQAPDQRGRGGHPAHQRTESHDSQNEDSWI